MKLFYFKFIAKHWIQYSAARSVKFVGLKWWSLRNLSADGWQVSFVNRARPTTKRIPGLFKVGRFILILWTLLGVCPFAFSEDEEQGVKYKVKIEGAKDGAVKKAIKESTVTYKLRKNLPSTVGQLRYRIEKDIPAIEAILEANGYYDGTVVSEISESREAVRVYLRIELGKQYRFRSVVLNYTGEPDPALKKIKPIVRKKRKVVATNVFEEQQRILELLTRNGYPFPKLVKRTIHVDREEKVVDLEWLFDPGRLAYFGPVQVAGLETLKGRYIKRQIPWREQDRYDAKKLDEFEDKMLGTGLFGSVRMSPQENYVGSNSIPVFIELKERSKRTIRVGVNYSDIGPGGKFYWEHRSFLGNGERLETSVSWNPIEYGGEIIFTRPGFLDANQFLVMNLDASVEETDAYDADKVRTTAMVLRDFTPKFQGGIGLGYKYSDVEQLTIDEKYGHILFPLQVIYDNRNDTLNPTRGGQFFARSTWFEDTLVSDNFLKTQAEGRKYFTLSETHRLSTAFRITLGNISGSSLDSIPADERFYAGGGGSIRGYEYQSVGPSVGDTPTGGEKLFEFSAELRLQPGRRLGYVAFVDGGTVYTDFPDVDADRSLRYGAGVGLRWFTTIGPLRADLAYPLNPDNNQVERLQFYISLGQAF